MLPAERRRIIRRVIKTTASDGVAGTFEPSHALMMACDASSSDDIFVDRLNDAVQTYHSHSRILRASTQNGVPTYKHVKRQKQPDLKWDEDALVGRITLYTYVLEPDECYDPRPVKHVDRVRKTLTKWLLAGMRGLVVDLRKHHGGSFRPGLHAIGGHILRGSPLHRWVTQPTSGGSWGIDQLLSYDGDRICYSDTPKTGIKGHPLPPVPVAVLLGPGTASSGEIIAACLHNKPGMRSFGAPTAGALSVNQGFALGNGLELLLTVRNVCTTDGACHTDERLVPDVLTPDPELAATTWLASVELGVKKIA
jgi:C-terminal processing protease CtpA/Prc